jgi:predicted nucleotidyltransferase
MEQNTSFEIINILTKEQLHVRAIAKKINVNHMTTSRTLKDLIKQNVVDAKTEGRNKVYFLKHTEEARNKILMTELYKLNKSLATYPQLRRIITTIQNNKKIKLAILFGSYAKNTATKSSDIDIFIETKNKTLKGQVEAIDSKISLKIGKLTKNHPLTNEIEKHHIIIKGAEQYYE